MKLYLPTKSAAALMLTTMLSACGGSSGSGDGATYTLTGTISGLTADGLHLTNGDETISPSAGATSFAFSTLLPSGATYNVTVSAAPNGLTCGVSNPSGTINYASTNLLAVSCFTSVINVLHPFTGATGDGAYPHGNLVADSSGNIYGTTAKGGSSDLGSVFKRDASGTLTLLHAFAGGSSDGATPYGSLLLGSDGNFYGMTFAGGASNLGTVFKITPAGVMTLLHSFAGGTGDGSSPRGSLIEGSDGNFYGMTYSGGASGLGSAFKITPAGALTLLHSFAGSTTDGAYPYGSLILGSDGNLYGTTSAGGASSKGTVFKLTPSGTESVMYSFAGGTADGSSPQGDLIQVGDYFYGVTLYGGSVNQGIVFRINPDNSETVLHAFDNSVDDAAVPIGGLILGNDGNLYGLSSRGGNFNLGAIFKIGLDGTETVLYSFAGGIGDGAYPNGNLLLGSDGNFYGMTNAGGSSNLGTVFEIPPL